MSWKKLLWTTANNINEKCAYLFLMEKVKFKYQPTIIIFMMPSSYIIKLKTIKSHNQNLIKFPIYYKIYKESKPYN